MTIKSISTYQKIFVILLFFIGVSFILTVPGIGILETFYKSTPPPLDWETLIKYPPGTYALLKYILTLFPPESSQVHFYKQTAWIIYKFILFSFYVLTWVSILVFDKKRKKSLSTSLLFLGSVTLTLVSLALSLPEIFAAPFLILSSYFTIHRRIFLAISFFLAACTFNITLLVILPLFVIFILKTNRATPFVNRLAILMSHVAPLTLLMKIALDLNLAKAMQSKIFGFPSLISQPLTLTSELSGLTKNIYFPISLLAGILAFGVTIFAFSYLLKNLILKKFKVKIMVISVILTIVGLLFLFTTLSLSTLLVLFFVLSYIFIVQKFIREKLENSTFFMSLAKVYLAFLIFIPGIPEGNLVWLVLFSLLAILSPDSKPSAKLNLFAVNLVTFINLFSHYGTAGVSPINGIFFSFSKLFLNVLFVVYAINFISTENFSRTSSFFLKKFLIIFMVFVNISLLTASGTGDVVSFNDTAIDTVTYLNPFRAHSENLQMYPPLSTVIISVFANARKILFGPTQNYKLAIKISIIVFYFATVFLFLKFKEKLGSSKITNQNTLFVVFTTFSLIIQTQGFSDINIYLIPTLIASIVVFFKKKYFLSGLLLGTTLVIKWIPIVILPVFGATLLDFKGSFREIAQNTLKFSIGLITSVGIVLLLLYIQPRGPESFYRTMDYIFNLSGFHYLSGQALNLNWIVTYFLHVFQPDKFQSLEELGFLNRQISSIDSPAIFRGLAFYIVWFTVVTLYFLRKRKNIFNFTATSLMVFFSYFILNKSVHEKHFFYTVIFALLLYILKPNKQNLKFLRLFDVMAVINLIFFYGFTGPKDVNRLFFGFDLTVLFAAYYVVIYLWVLTLFLRGKIFTSLSLEKQNSLSAKALRQSALPRKYRQLSSRPRGLSLQP